MNILSHLPGGLELILINGGICFFGFVGGVGDAIVFSVSFFVSGGLLKFDTSSVVITGSSLFSLLHSVEKGKMLRFKKQSSILKSSMEVQDTRHLYKYAVCIYYDIYNSVYIYSFQFHSEGEGATPYLV